MPTDKRLFISVSKHGTAGNMIAVDWGRVVSLELCGDAQAKMFTEITLDTGKSFQVRELPSEIVKSVQNAKNGNADGSDTEF